MWDSNARYVAPKPSCLQMQAYAAKCGVFPANVLARKAGFPEEQSPRQRSVRDTLLESVLGSHLWKNEDRRNGQEKQKCDAVTAEASADPPGWPCRVVGARETGKGTQPRAVSHQHS